MSKTRIHNASWDQAGKINLQSGFGIKVAEAGLCDTRESCVPLMEGAEAAGTRSMLPGGSLGRGG